MIHEIPVMLLLTEEQFREAENLSYLLDKSKDQLATEGLVELVMTLYDNPERLALLVADRRGRPRS